MGKKRGNGGFWLLGVLLVAVLILGTLGRRNNAVTDEPRAQYNDSTPLGGRGLALVLERLGYGTKRETGQLTAMPQDAAVWLILDPQTRITRDEAQQLLTWVEKGHTLIWCLKNSPTVDPFFSQGQDPGAGLETLKQELDVEYRDVAFQVSKGQLFPDLTPLNFTSASVYRTGVTKAQGPAGTFSLEKPHLDIAGTVVGLQLARVTRGFGQIFILPDCMMATNYALSHSDNAILITNLVRASEPQGVVYFDERQNDEKSDKSFQPSLLYYLWRPPLRWAWLELALAGLLFWVLAARRLGQAIPLPQRGPVTRASQFAVAMGGLFHKVDRPKAAGAIVGDHFRRQLAKRLGMSPNDPDSALAQRAYEIAGLPVDLVDRLLLNSRTPSESEAAALRDAQEMELVLRQLNIR